MHYYNTYYKTLQKDLNKCQTLWLKELLATPFMKVHYSGKQGPVPDRLSKSPIIHNSVDKGANSQPSGVSQNLLCPFCGKQ